MIILTVNTSATSCASSTSFEADAIILAALTFLTCAVAFVYNRSLLLFRFESREGKCYNRLYNMADVRFTKECSKRFILFYRLLNNNFIRRIKWHARFRLLFDYLFYNLLLAVRRPSCSLAAFRSSSFA